MRGRLGLVQTVIRVSFLPGTSQWSWWALQQVEFLHGESASAYRPQIGIPHPWKEGTYCDTGLYFQTHREVDAQTEFSARYPFRNPSLGGFSFSIVPHLLHNFSFRKTTWHALFRHLKNKHIFMISVHPYKSVEVLKSLRSLVWEALLRDSSVRWNQATKIQSIPTQASSACFLHGVGNAQDPCWFRRMSLGLLMHIKLHIKVSELHIHTWFTSHWETWTADSLLYFPTDVLPFIKTEYV